MYVSIAFDFAKNFGVLCVLSSKHFTRVSNGEAPWKQQRRKMSDVIHDCYLFFQRLSVFSMSVTLFSQQNNKRKCKAIK